jgi:release factor glutamine methyltransferase
VTDPVGACKEPLGETWAAALQRLTAEFAAAGLETPDLDARLLLAHVLAVSPIKFVTERGTRIACEMQPAIAAVKARRLAHEPVSRILGERWFYGRPFRVTPATLDPRPDSETLIDAALSLVKEAGITPEKLSILDIGTGTGCLLLTLLCELPGAWGCGTDVSADALEVAADNGHRLRQLLPPSGAQFTSASPKALHNISWRHGPDFTAVAGSTFNLIVANPPYIPRGDIDGLSRDVRHFDPMIALDGGPDGLAVYRRLAAELPLYLSDGWAVFEVGAGQAADVAALLKAGFSPLAVELRVFKDLGGVERCVAVSPRETMR